MAQAANSLTTSHLDKWRQDTPFRLLVAATDLPTEPARSCVLQTDTRLEPYLYTIFPIGVELDPIKIYTFVILSKSRLFHFSQQLKIGVSSSISAQRS